ncbi:hypothetical protein FA13DRAFT_1741206 [Coprinellus micaceus]|uniref:Uncharacterized protein n=1 Tax=Coprinellus micaceus TaxID=71717 RepID=A0A4Y7SKG3_COPMI|nr:hypothetical protein FA13DRAFT_1741206 [Coprinellus micaceus]
MATWAGTNLYVLEYEDRRLVMHWNLTVQSLPGKQGVLSKGIFSAIFRKNFDIPGDAGLKFYTRDAPGCFGASAEIPDEILDAVLSEHRIRHFGVECIHPRPIISTLADQAPPEGE